MDGIVRAKRPARVPVVLSENEVRALLARLDGKRWLVATLLYATGMRLLEGLRLRVKDVDFERREITVRDGKGGARPQDHAAGAPDRAAALAPRSRKGSARARPCGGFRRGLSAVRAGAQVSAGRAKLGLAIRVSIRQPVKRSSRRDGAPAPSGRESGPAPCWRRRARPGWPSPCRRTSCGTALPRTCSRAATTSGRCRNCSATKTFRRRWSTPMFSTRVAAE